MQRVAQGQLNLMTSPAHDLRIVVPTRFGHPEDYPVMHTHLRALPSPLEVLVLRGSPSLRRIALLLEVTDGLRECAWYLRSGAAMTVDDRRNFQE